MYNCSTSPTIRPASSRATTAMRSSSPSPTCRLWGKISPPFLPRLQLASPPACASVASTPLWMVGPSSAYFTTSPMLHLKAGQSFSTCFPGGVKVTCEYKTQHEGLLQEHITLVTKGRRENRLKVRLQAKVIGGSSNTPTVAFGC